MCHHCGLMSRAYVEVSWITDLECCPSRVKVFKGKYLQPSGCQIIAFTTCCQSYPNCAWCLCLGCAVIKFKLFSYWHKVHCSLLSFVPSHYIFLCCITSINYSSYLNYCNLCVCLVNNTIIMADLKLLVKESSCVNSN